MTKATELKTAELGIRLKFDDLQSPPPAPWPHTASQGSRNFSKHRTLVPMGSCICMEARDPDDLPRILSYPLWLEFSSDPWPFFFFFFFQSKASMPGNRGSDGRVCSKDGGGANGVLRTPHTRERGGFRGLQNSSKKKPPSR